MSPSQLMQALSDAGAPMEAIIIALRALEEKDAEIAARDAAAAAKRAKDAERTAARRELLPVDWDAIRLAVFERDGWECSYCGTTDADQWHCDHIVPLSRSGPNDMDNLTTACRSCNSSKGDRLLEEWHRGY